MFKKIAFVSAILALTLSACTSVNAEQKSPVQITQERETAEWENEVCDGQYFSTANVDSVREWWDNTECVTYSDPDANCMDCAIYLTPESGAEVRHALEYGAEMSGELQLVSEEGSRKVFSVKWN